MDVQKYFDMFKIFKLKGNPYIFVFGDNLFGIDVGFESIYQLKLPMFDLLQPADEYIACNINEIDQPEPVFSNIRIYNLLYPFVCKYALSQVYAMAGDRLDDDIGTRVYGMKAGDGNSMIKYHLEKDIDINYVISLNYSLFPLSKGDDVTNFVYHDRPTNGLVMRSVIHKKKQKVDIIVYHRFLII